MKLRRLLCCVLWLCAAAMAAPRIDLNPDWHFRIDPDKSGERNRWFAQVPTDAEPVDLPHTWNLGKYEEFQGTAWYFKAFSDSGALRGKHIEVHFGAAFYKSRVWLNGKFVGEHEGGYTEFFFDISSLLQETNLLAVEINNEPKVDTIPGADLKAAPNGAIYDWWPYGGIVRGAWLKVNDGVVARWQHIKTRMNGSSADVTSKIQVENATGRAQAIKVLIRVFEADKTVPVVSAEKDLRLQPGIHVMDCALQVQNVKRWALDNPFLYRSEVVVLTGGGRVLDKIQDTFGVRTIEIRDRYLYLNGERVRLTGVTRHEDSPWEGLAETRGTMLHDLEELRDLHTTITRPVHYPQNPFIYDFADRNGILLIPEIPMWQFDESQMTNPKVITLAKQELHELIVQNYNHPSIFAWSMENESATNTPGGLAYFRLMYAYAKELDSERFVSFADDMIAFADPATNASRFADFIMWNEYFGSWDGPETLLPAAFEKIKKGYPDKMVIVTEFGYPGVFATDSITADVERQRVIRDHLAMFARHDWIAGAMLWCYQDYHSTHNLRPGQPDSYVDHGLVDKNRQRRPSYYTWREETEPAHTRVAWDVNPKGVPTGFHASITRRSEQEIPSYALLNYRLQWRLLDDQKKELAGNTRVLPAVGPPNQITETWTASESNNLRLQLTLLRPDGTAVQTRMLKWHRPQEGTFTPDNLGSEAHNP